MRNIKNMLVFSLLLFFLINVPLLKADTCSDSVKEAEDIEVTTKVETVKWEDNGGITSYNIYVIIKNITANTYVVVMNDLNDKVEYLGYEDSDNGVIKLKTYNPYKKINYVVRAYTKDVSCKEEAVSTKKVSPAVFNSYHEMEICGGRDDIEMCEQFYDSSKMNIDEFRAEVQKIIDEKNKNILWYIADFLKKYYLFILIPIVIVVSIFGVRIAILKRGKDDE